MRRRSARGPRAARIGLQAEARRLSEGEIRSQTRVPIDRGSAQEQDSGRQPSPSGECRAKGFGGERPEDRGAPSPPKLLPVAGGSGAVASLGELVMILELHWQRSGPFSNALTYNGLCDIYSVPHN